ncbi:hypothetical protein [Hyperthermus butylicus]|uniref:hypothetical protein n=1 Tax=Hyperthermus butylicus TaxID=54248 RepID=UPI0003216A01|nr:hypothetical protein [Hyperthermus butylicus]
MPKNASIQKLLESLDDAIKGLKASRQALKHIKVQVQHIYNLVKETSKEAGIDPEALLRKTLLNEYEKTAKTACRSNPLCSFVREIVMYN